MRFLRSIVCYLLCLTSFASVSEPSHKNDLFMLKKGRMNSAGTLSIPIEINRHEDTKIGINLSPQFGYFVADNLELRGIFNLTAQFGRTAIKNQVTPPLFWDVGAQVVYYFTANAILRPYIGIGLGVGFMDLNIYSLNVIADAPIGLLISLNENFALDVGIPVRIRMSMRSLVDRVQITPGVIGIRYFF